jgi:hypothetical protein
VTLLREIQILLERTYGKTGVNLEHFLLDNHRNRQLADMVDPSLLQAGGLGRVFLRVTDGKLRLGIHFAKDVIESLERSNPQHGLNEQNIFPFMVLLEEIDHAVHASLKFREGTRDVMNEEFVCDLEVQAKVDTYLILQYFCSFFNPGNTLTNADRRWLRACVFDSQIVSHREAHLRRRYLETNRLARRYTRHLDTLTARRRTGEIRRFRQLSYRAKQAHVVKLAA